MAAAIPTVELDESQLGVLEAFTGLKLPRVTLALLWDDTSTARTLAHRTRTVLVPLLEQTIKAVGEAGEGEVFDRFVAQTAPFVKKVAETADLMIAAAEAMWNFFKTTESGKRTAAIMFSFMMAEFASIFAMWFWNPVGAAARYAQARSLIHTILRSTVVRSAASSMAMQMLYMPGSALLSEVSMMTDGLQSGVNWGVVGQQAAFAASAALLGTVAGPALGKVAGAVAAGVSKLGVSDTVRPLLTDVLTRPVTETGMEVVIGIAVTGMMTGGVDLDNVPWDAASGALSGGGGSAAAVAGFAAGRVVKQPRVQVPHIGFTSDGKPVLPVESKPGVDPSTGYQTGVDDPKAVGTSTQAPPPTPPPRPASNLPMPPPTPLSLNLPRPSLDLSVPSWSVPAAPAPEWVVAAGVPVVEQWQRFQQDLVDRYGGLLAGVAQAGKSMAALAVPVERVFAEWVDARQGDPAVRAFLSAVGLPGTALTEEFLTGVRERAVARMAEALASAGEQIPAEVWSEQVIAALPAAFDRQALREMAQLAAQYHIGQYLAAGLPTGTGTPTGAGTSSAAGLPAGAGVPGGAGAVPSAAVREAVEHDVWNHMARSVDEILGTSALPPVLPAVLPAAVASPDAAQVAAVANVVRQAVTDLPARFTAAAIPDATGPAATWATVDVPESGRTGAPTVPITPEQHTTAAAGPARDQFNALAHRYGVDPARHDPLAESFKQKWADGYHQVLAQVAGSATPGTPGTPDTPGTAGTPGTPDAASARSTVPAGAASRVDDTPIHHNANANASDRDSASGSDSASDSDSDSASDRDSASDSDSATSVSSDDVFSNLDTSDTGSLSEVFLRDESLGGVPGKPGLGDTGSLSDVFLRDEPVSGDPGKLGEPAVAATGPAIGMFESGQRAANWAAAEQARAGSSGAPWWCVAATLDVFQTEYKRLGNRAVFDDRILGPDGRLAPTMGWPQLMEILDTVPERVAHPDGVAGEDVLAALKAAPGSMVVVKAAPPNERQHVFALHSQPQESGPPRIQVRDPLVPDAANRPEPKNPIQNAWLQHLFMSSTRVAAFDGNGRPTTITDLLGQTAGHPRPITTTGTDTSAFLLASTSTPRGPSQAMQADTTFPDPADSPRQPSEPAENDEPAGTGVAFIDQAFQNVVGPDPDRMDLDTPTLDKGWEPPGGTEQVESDLLAEANRVRADEGVRRQEDKQQRADPHSADDERERVETERRDAENTELQAETWRQAELRDGVDAAAGTADRMRLEQTVTRHQEQLDRATKAAPDAGTAWERAVEERDRADATRAAAKGDAREPEPATPQSFADGAIGELSVPAGQQLRPQEMTDTVTQLMHLVGVTEGVTVRDDLGVIATSAEEVSGTSGASLAADASALGLTHVATPNHRVLTREEDPQEQTGQQTQAVASGGALTEHRRGVVDDLVRQEVESQLTAAPQVEPQPAVPQTDESAQVPAPDPAPGGMTEAVRQYGSQLDGMQGLEHVTPVPESVVEWLREQVKAAVGARGTRAAFGAQLDRRLTARYLFAEWPRVRSESGLPLSIPADGGQTPWLRVVLGDAAAADPGIEQLRDGPPVAFQRWAFGGWEVAETATASDLRSMNLPFSYSHKWPVENLGKLRRAVLTVQPTVTYNQMSTSVRVSGGVQALTILRSRERSWPYMYQMHWQMRVGDDVSRPWIDLTPPAERLTVWFPKHVVEIPPENTEQPRPARLDTLRNDVPLFGVQSVPNADRILSDVMASFRPHLTSLSKASRGDLQEFFGEYSLRGDIPLMWVGIQPSPLLFAEDGSVIGYLRVRADLYERGVAGPATQNAVLESHVLRILRVEGSAKVTNAVGVDGSVSFGMSRAPADPVTGVEPTGGTVRGQLGGRHQVSHTLGSGGGARTSHSLRTSKPLIPLAADVIFDVELVRADGAVVRPEPSTPLGWSGAPHLVILRVPPADTVTKPTTPRYLPPEIAQLRSLGVSTTPLRVTGAEPLLASAETWLRERGFLPPDGDPSLADRLTDEATRIQRLENVRKLDLARSGMGQRGAVDEMIEGGYPIVFELPVRGEIQRVEVRLSADRRFADEPEGGVSHDLFLPDIQTLNWTGSTLPASEKRARSPFGWNAGFAGSYSNPLDLGDQSRPLQSISSGVNRSSRPATITETSIGFGQELYALSPSADGSHTFKVPVALRMEISWSYGPVPEPSSVDGMFVLAVPTYRTLAQSVEISPYQMPAPREVTHQDRARLNQPDGDAVYQNGVLRLPELALVDRVEGSRSIRAVVSDLVGAVRRAAAAAERSAASSNVMPGTFPVDDAAVPPQVAGDIEMQTAESPPDSAETNSAQARMPHGEAREDRTPAMPGAFPPDEATGPVQVRGNEPVADDQTVAPSGGAGRTSWFGGLVVGGWTWAKRRVIGESLSRPESMGQEVAHAAVSPHHLSANALQVFDNQYVSENIGEHGMVWGTDVSVTVEGYLIDVETLPPPGTMDMESWLQSFDGSSQTAESSVLYEVPTAVTGTYGSDTQFVPSGTYTYGTREDAHTTFSDNTMAFRVTTENDVSMFRFKARAIYIVTVTKGSRNVVAGTLSGSPFFERQLAVELPEAVEFLLTENDLFNYPELRQIPGVPQADPERPAEPADRMLPHWFVRSGGELGFGVATAVIPRGSRSQFREGIRALVEAQAPGVTRPGHSAYLPGILSRIADHSSPLALRTLINAGPKGRASFHFVHRSWLGPRLVEVEITAQPSQSAAQLAGLRGRKTSTTAGLDVILAHSSGEGGSLQIAGASKRSATRATGNKVAFSPLVKRGEQQSQSPLAIATQHSRTNAASSLREYRTWQRTLATTQFDRVPYTLGVTARSMPLSDALIVAAGRAAINGLLAVGRLVRLAWQDLPRVSATSESYLAVPALVTLRFSEAETLRDLIVEQERVEPAMFTSDPTLVVPPPTDTVAVDMEVPAEIRALVAGAPWRPSRAFSVYDFDAVAQLAEAIRTVDPSLAGDDQLHNSVSAEGIFLRLAQLARSGKVTMLEPAAVGRLLGRAGTPGTSLQFALYTPGSTSTSRNVAIDSVYANTDTFATIVNSSVIPTFGFSHTAPFTHDGNNYGGPMVPIAGVEAAQDQSAGGFGQRREIIRFGTPIESADGNGTPGYQLTAVAVIRVGGPRGTRWVVGNIEIRTTEAPAGADNLVRTS